MSASERLKALIQPALDDGAPYHAGCLLAETDALPQIVALVEKGEQVLDYENTPSRSSLSDLRAALSALDEALS